MGFGTMQFHTSTGGLGTCPLWMRGTTDQASPKGKDFIDLQILPGCLQLHSSLSPQSLAVHTRQQAANREEASARNSQCPQQSACDSKCWSHVSEMRNYAIAWFHAVSSKRSSKRRACKDQSVDRRVITMEGVGFHTAACDQDNLKQPVLRVCDVPGHDEEAGRMQHHSLIFVSRLRFLLLT